MKGDTGMIHWFGMDDAHIYGSNRRFKQTYQSGELICSTGYGDNGGHVLRVITAFVFQAT